MNRRLWFIGRSTHLVSTNLSFMGHEVSTCKDADRCHGTKFEGLRLSLAGIIFYDEFMELVNPCDDCWHGFGSG